MIKKFNVIKTENSKYYKDVPYITKKDFREIDDAIVLDQTRLKEYKSSSEEKELDLLMYDEEQYEIKNKIFGFKKGYVYVGDNNYIMLKWRIPFLFLLFLLLLLFLFFLFVNFDKKQKEPVIDIPVQNEIIIPEEKEEEPQEEVIEEKKETSVTKKENPPVILPSKEYTIFFDANGGYGSMDSIICKIDNECSLSKNVFKKDGYTFIGWSTEKEGQPLYNDELKINNLTNTSGEKITLYAMWEVMSFKIAFVDYDKSIIKEEILDYGDDIISPEDPIRIGYTFSGWDKELEVVKEEQEIGALYEINDYSIEYDLNGGILKEAPKNYNVESEDILIPSPNKIGYTFIGWSTLENLKPIIDYKISTGTVDNIKLTANYDANSYNLIFNSSKENDALIIRQVKFDSNYGELPDAHKEGYIFKGWKNQDGEFVSSDTMYDTPEDVNLYAEWETITYDIAYNLNGGTLNDAPKNYNVESEDILIPSPSKEGYIFTGWTTSDNSTPVKDYIIKTGTIGNKELIANYKAITYYISYDANSGTGSMNNDSIEYNQTFKLSKNNFTKIGYTFIGWATSRDNSVVYQDEASIYNLTFTEGEIIKLYAKWEIIQLNVKFYDLFGSLLKEEKVNYGSKAVLPEDPFITGYTFDKWNPSNEPITSDTDYHAEYILNEYTIKYNLNMGGSDDLKAINYNVESGVIELPNPTRNGYTFLGWTGSNGLKPQVNLTIPKGSTGDKSYKANWTSNEYQVSLNPNGGQLDVDYILISYNSLYGILPSPTRDGYTFEGWYYNDTLIKEDTLQDKNSNHELKAKWKVITYDIAYNLNGGILDNPPKKYTIESEDIVIPSPNKKGYNFIGWSTSDNNTPVKDYIIKTGTIGNKKLIANYELITYYISYDANGGTGSMNNDSVKYNQTFKLSKNNFTKTGYTFIGWATSRDGSVVYQNEASIYNLSFTEGETIKLYAKWQVVYYDVVYNLNGGSTSPLQTSYSIESDSFTLPHPTRRGYTFIGWTGSNGTTPSMNVSVPKGSTGNKNYTANYSLNVYTITYSTSMSSLPSNPITYTVESESFTLKNPNKYGEFSFVGWSGTDVSDKQINLTIPKGSIGNRHYTANWYDDTPPTITGFEVRNLGINDNGHDIYIFVEGYDNGVGIDRYETWLVPYKNGAGAGRELGGERIITNVLYLKDPEGRTLCGYAIDKNGNEAERCYTVYG